LRGAGSSLTAKPYGYGFDVSAPTPKARIFRLPALAYAAVLFLLFCVLPLSFGDKALDSSWTTAVGFRTLALLVPVLAAAFIARTATIVDAEAVVVRAIFGSRRLPWDDVRGLSVSGRSVYAVLDDGSVRLPCVTVSNLAEVSRASGARLPEIPEPVRKTPPTRRRRG
jgi:hypothetical protein